MNSTSTFVNLSSLIESFGVFTGTEGMVTYQMGDGEPPFEFRWDVPFFQGVTPATGRSRVIRIFNSPEMI